MRSGSLGALEEMWNFFFFFFSVVNAILEYSENCTSAAFSSNPWG